MYDVVKAVHLLMTTPAAEGEVFNVAGHTEINIRDLAELVIKRTGSSSRIAFVPFTEVYGEGFEEMSRRAADTTKLQAAINFSCDTTLVETLDTMIDFARESIPR